MGEYLSFIKPSETVDWFFISVFALLYLFAVGCALYAQSTRAKRGSDLADDASRDDVENALYTGYDALVERLPGVFITIGLLGTFLGLGLAVTDAAKVLASSTIDPSKLFGDVLQPIGFKFRVSVWGILFSLLCRLAPGVLLSRYRRSQGRQVWLELRERFLKHEKAAQAHDAPVEIDGGRPFPD